MTRDHLAAGAAIVGILLIAWSVMHHERPITDAPKLPLTEFKTWGTLSAEEVEFSSTVPWTSWPSSPPLEPK